MPVFECPECGSYVHVPKTAKIIDCHGCQRTFKVNLYKSINYEGKPIGFVHYREMKTTTTADVFLDLETLLGSRRIATDVNKGRGSVVS